MMKYILFFVIILILVSVYLSFSIKYTNKQFDRDFDNFNKASINGVVEYVIIKHHGIGFKVTNNSSEFVFYPYTDRLLNKNKIFDAIAENGDRIIKPAFSDTLMLFKNKIEYRYTFEHGQGHKFKNNTSK